MKDTGFCFLAIGDRYVEEFKSLSSTFPKNNIVICSDRQIDDYHTIIVDEEFNFNLKSKSIVESLQKFDKVVSLDTDHVITSLPKNLFDDIPYGISVKWIGNDVEYLDKKINSSDVINGNTEFDDVNEYGKVLYDLTKTEIKFIDESVIAFNFKNKRIKNKFIKNYLNIIEKTEGKQPFRYTDKKMGAMEGCIIHAAAVLSNLDINTDISSELDKHFYHYGPKVGHTLKLNQNKSLI